MYSAIHCSSKLNPTPAQCFLDNYLSISKRATSLIYRMVAMFLTFRSTRWHGAHLTTCAKKHKKSVKKLEWKYYTNNLCIPDAMQLCISSIHYIIQLFFEKLKLKVDIPMQSEQSMQICYIQISLYVQTKTSCKAEDKMQRQVDLGDYFCISTPKR